MRSLHLCATHNTSTVYTRVVLVFPLAWGVTGDGVRGVQAIRLADAEVGVYHPLLQRFFPTPTLRFRADEQAVAARVLVGEHCGDEAGFYTALLYASCGAATPNERTWRTVGGASRTELNVVAVGCADDAAALRCHETLED